MIDEKKSGIKPDLVHYGGNYAAQQLAGGTLRWAKNFVYLGEPTIQKENEGRFVGSRVGTSFAAPHVAHAAAVAARSLEAALGRAPSANLIRALVGSTATLPTYGCASSITEEDALRLIGYGMPSTTDIAESRPNRVLLIAMDEIEEDRLHIYRIVVPRTFIDARGRRGITVALAYDPPVRSSRREYLARTMTVEALHGLTLAEVEEYRGRYMGGEAPQLPLGSLVNLRAPKTRLQWSTLQVRRVAWRNRLRLRVAAGETEPVIHLLVECRQRFRTGLEPRQQYGLSVLFWHQDARVDLYQALRTRIRVSAVRVRVES